MERQINLKNVFEKQFQSTLKLCRNCIVEQWIQQYIHPYPHSVAKEGPFLYDNAYFCIYTIFLYFFFFLGNCESLKIVSKNYTKRDEVGKAEKFVLCDVQNYTFFYGRILGSQSLQHTTEQLAAATKKNTKSQKKRIENRLQTFFWYI